MTFGFERSFFTCVYKPFDAFSLLLFSLSLLRKKNTLALVFVELRNNFFLYIVLFVIACLVNEKKMLFYRSGM